MPIDVPVNDLDVDVLIVDDDVLASTLIQLVIGKRAEAKALALQSTSEAVRLLRRAAAGEGGRLSAVGGGDEGEDSLDRQEGIGFGTMAVEPEIERSPLESEG